MTEVTAGILQDIQAISRIEAVPTLLQVLCQTTGMGFAVVARVTDASWTACAVRDDIQFGLKAGGELDVNTTLCKEVRDARQPIVIDHASQDPLYCNHHTPKLYAIESYISVPIVLSDGEYFGNLCAIDPRPARLSQPSVVAMFQLFGQLIGLELENQRKREETAQALLQEREVGELREQFIAVLGHDLRNPLSAIAACAQVLGHKPDDPGTVKAMAQRIVTNTRRMAGLIEDVMDFARGRLGGGIGVGAARVNDVDSALLQVAGEIRDAHPGRQIGLAIDVGRPVDCDLGRIQQLASNLLANAISHGDPAGRIEFKAHADDQDLVIEVWNEGEPIPPARLGSLFAPFWRDAATPRREGLGLGLYICSQIAAGHAGRLGVTSSREGGTRFTARLPLSRPGAALPPS